ncbi:MAG: GLPGLI family protein [Flavobacterium sp.]
MILRIVFCFISLNFLFSQNIYVEYIESKIPSLDLNAPRGIEILMSKKLLYTLEISNDETLFKNHEKSKNYKIEDTIFTVDFEEIRVSNFNNNSVEKSIYKNFKTNEFINVYQNTNIVDQLINWDWKLINETKKINNFICKKAVGSNFGMKYTVWYTEEIPYGHGPFIIDSLPGLVIYADNGLTKWEFNNINFDREIKIKKPISEVNPNTIEEEIIKSKRKSFETLKNKSPNTKIYKFGN